jgi:TrmH family RNA methyltransferase
MPNLTISTENAEYQIIQALKLNRTKRHKAKEVFIEGIESIKQAVSAGLEITRIIAADVETLSSWSKDLIHSNRQTKIISMKFDLYKSICDREEPSEIVITAKIKPLSIRDLSLPSKPFVLVFDRPSDYGNLGSLIRSANSFGVDAVLITGHSVDMYDPKVIRSSLGSIFHTKVASVESMQEFEAWINEQKKGNNISLVGTDSTGNASLLTHKLTRPIAVVLGNEAKGMSVALKNMCDTVISIPLTGAVNSLNVACAGSIILWDVYKNR